MKLNPEYVTKAKAAALGAVTLRSDHRALAIAYGVSAVAALSGGLVSFAAGVALAALCTHVGYVRGTPLTLPPPPAI